MPLWHERDISHSSVERLIAPDSTVLLDFMLARLTRLLKNLQVYPGNMTKNLNLTHGLVFSQSLLLALIEKGLSRDAAYRLVQRPAMLVWQEGGEFPQRVQEDKEIGKHLTQAELTAIFDLSRYLRHVDTIFARVFGVGTRVLSDTDSFAIDKIVRHERGCGHPGESRLLNDYCPGGRVHSSNFHFSNNLEYLPDLFKQKQLQDLWQGL